MGGVPAVSEWRHSAQKLQFYHQGTKAPKNLLSSTPEES
jgi:hypothetical protein